MFEIFLKDFEKFYIFTNFDLRAKKDFLFSCIFLYRKKLNIDGAIVKSQKYIFLYLLALNIKIKPEKQDKNNFQKNFFFWWVYIFFLVV